MFPRTVRPRNLPVCNVSDERVLERELRLAFDRTSARALHELLLPKRVQLLLRRIERAEPKHLSDHCRILE